MSNLDTMKLVPNSLPDESLDVAAVTGGGLPRRSPGLACLGVASTLLLVGLSAGAFAFAPDGVWSGAGGSGDARADATCHREFFRKLVGETASWRCYPDGGERERVERYRAKRTEDGGSVGASGGIIGRGGASGARAEDPGGEAESIHGRFGDDFIRPWRFGGGRRE